MKYINELINSLINELKKEGSELGIVENNYILHLQDRVPMRT